MWPFQSKAAPQREASETPRQPEISYLNSGLGVAIVKWNEHIQMNAAMRHPIVSRALDKIALSFQQVGWNVVDDPKASAQERSGNARAKQSLQNLVDSPNDDMTPEMLRYWLALNYAGYGRAPYKVGTGLVTKLANGIYPLEARYVRVHQNNMGMVRQYQYGDGEEAQYYPSRSVFLKNPNENGFADQIWKPGLRGYQHKDDSNTPMNAIGLPAQVVKALLIRAIQTAEGHPNVRYMVTTDRGLNAEQKKALGEYLNQDHGPQGPDAGNIPLLTNAGQVTIHTLDNDLSDIHSKTPSDDMARLIFGAFGIPIALAGMGAADGAKFAGNYIESRQAFWQDTIIPGYVTPITNGISRSICPPGLMLQPDYGSIPALQQGRVLAMKELKDVDYLTQREKRALMGYTEAPDGPTVGELNRQSKAPGGQNE